MDEKNDMDKVDEVMLPGFRFHPTDEELVGFYLKRKIQQRPLSIELIKQLDIYKYDPWDLPKMATTGEKEWYFYCPRDRKYRNSARPNRVTGAGFWKATGTDRPIYASEGTKCIGLKKSLVFYRGRAAKGIKTDWMMHEFRLPSVSDSSTHPKRPIDKNLPANDSWAICRIFKKTNSMAQRALSRSWVSPVAETSNCSDIYSHLSQGTNFGAQQSISCTSTESVQPIQFCCNNDLQQPSSLDDPSFLPISATEIIPCASFMFAPPLEISAPPKPGVDFTSMLINLSPSILGEYPSRSSGSTDFGSHKQSHNNMGMYENVDTGEGESCCFMNSDTLSHGNNQWVSLRTLAFPFNLASNLSDAWKPSSSNWDSLPCPTETSTTNYSTNKCYI